MTKYASYILYLLITILVVILYANGFGPVDNMQRSLDDLLCKITASEGKRPNVALVNIDARAEDKFGEWPWDYDLIADLTAATASGNPSAILLDLDLPEDASQDSAGYTKILAGQLRWIDKAVLSYDIALTSYRSSVTNNPEELFNNSILTDNPVGILSDDATLLARKVFLPADRLLAHKPYLGFDYDAPDEDRVLRREPLVMHFDGYYYPSQALITAALHLGLSPNDIKINENEAIYLGSKRIVPIREGSEYYIRFHEGNPFVSYSARDVLSEGFDLDKLADKAVIIAVDDPRYSERFRTPLSDDMPSSWVKATVIENIVNSNFLTPSRTAGPVTMLILFVLGGVCAFALPRVSMLYRFIILGGALIILMNASYLLVSSFGIIPQTLYIGLQLVLFIAASPMLDSSLLTGEVKTPAKATHVKPQRSRPKPAPQRVDTGEIPVREIKTSAEDPENLETRALDTPTGAKATPTVFDHQAINIDGRDETADEASIDVDTGEPADESSAMTPPEGIQVPEDRDYTADEDLPNFDSPASDLEIDKAQPVSDTGGLPKIPTDIKNLGRYQVTEVLGKGAMGLVYRGIDPAINRPVALKTIRLDFVNDPEEMAELKERLYREAQAAGKLSHPNIVTIYDVGSEGHLQYIAMEYLEGVTLEDMIKKKTKFNYRIIAQIILQICTALDYAHEQGIVHRDIKPANIMILKDYRVKVMDYGIARIDSNSMTKTGVAMGTPNYISPEQLRGQKIDRRADIFSLGVVMYEMLLGRRPFKGENITSLIYAIINSEPQKPSNVNPQVPLLFDHVIMKALAKDPATRYQRAGEIVNDLHDFVESFVNR